jgi:3',5'-cyclic AMP phosphodiesterase CpdA
MTSRDWLQLAIVHLSDIHFGKPHRFQPEMTPSGDRAAPEGIPSLAESVLHDACSRLHDLHKGKHDCSLNGLRSLRPESVRLAFALTGDLTESASYSEFQQAEDLVDVICKKSPVSEPLTADDIFVVPGNHDLIYDKPTSYERWHYYCSFYEAHAKKRLDMHPSAIDPKTPNALTRVIDQSKHGLVVAEINSAAYVQKGTLDSLRGQVDLGSLKRLKEELKAIDPSTLHRSVRIALIHHHPVVLPTMAEAGRGYDAVVHASALLGLLKEFGFQLILHGHKHDAQTFPHDSVSAWSGSGSQPIMVVSGGSAGSNSLPGGAAMNSYNIIGLKWHPKSGQARVRIETRGLVLYDERNQPLLPSEWRWKELRVDDRILRTPLTSAISRGRQRERSDEDREFEQHREKELKRVRRCWPAAEVIPSLRIDQGFEARVWLDGQSSKEDYERPVRVEWWAGPYFPKIVVVDAPQFSARFSYYGPMSVQARMYWKDGGSAVSYIFAHYPGSGSTSAVPQ